MPELLTDDGVILSYRTIGEGRRTVLFVHGWMTSGVVWEPLLETLQVDDARFIVPDLRGAGSSEGAADYSLERYARDVLAVAEAAGASSFDLVGHSMGGQIAQLVAARAPEKVRRLALLSPVPAAGLELPDEARRLFETSARNPDRQAAILREATLNLEEGDRQRLVEAAGVIPEACIRGALEAWTAGGFAERLGEITAETLVVAGDDPFLPVDFLQEAVVEPIPSARLVHIGSAGHYLHLEQREAVADELERFLSS